MQRSFQPVMTTIVLTAAMLLACVPVSAGLVLDDGATHNLDYVVAGDVNVYNTTTANLLSGSVIGGSLAANEDSTVNVSGGTIEDDLQTYDSSTVTVFGTGFNVGYGVYADGDPLDGATLTGTLADGTDFNNLVKIYHSATVTLAAPVGGGAVVPEPSSMAMFGIGALGLFVYSRRRRQTLAVGRVLKTPSEICR